MRRNRSPAVILAIVIVLTLGLAASCGGGEEQQSNGQESEGNTAGGSPENGGTTTGATEGAAQSADGGATNGGSGSSPKIKIALGDILRIDSENSLVVLKPPEAKRQVFKVMPGAEVTVDDSPAQLADLEKRQQAQIRYVVINDRNRARAVSAFSDGG